MIVGGPLPLMQGFCKGWFVAVRMCKGERQEVFDRLGAQ